MLIKIDDICTYTHLTWKETTPTNSTKLKEFMDLNVPGHTLLNYTDPDLLEAAMEPLRTWSFANYGGETVDIDTFPFVIYTEVHDDMSPSQYPRVLLYGYDAVTSSNIIELYQLGRS